MRFHSCWRRRLDCTHPRRRRPRACGTGEGPSHEHITLATDPASGLRAIIAIHDTSRGPAFGGCRYWTYAAEQDALTDALRLSQGMSYKNALAGLPFGGGP